MNPRHPHLHAVVEKRGALRALDDVRRAAEGEGLARRLWERVLAAADEAVSDAPILPSTPVAHRGAEALAHANPDYTVCRAAHDRILSAALASLLTGEVRYRDAALAQIEALFDDRRWPDWRDIAHREFGAADLRTGMLGKAIGLGYDWLHGQLTAAQRHAIVDGLERRAFRPFWECVDRRAWWINGMTNWTTCIVGGLGIAAMAVEPDCPQAAELIEFSLERLLRYRSEYGPEGEFNESVGYSSATELPVEYFMAHWYHTGGGVNRVGEPPFPQACRWYAHFTLPPGRLAAFGDGHVEAPPMPAFVAAVAQAARDPLLQWFYQEHAQPTAHSLAAFELLWFDPTLAPRAPGGVWPHGRAFPAHGGCVSSRTDWNPRRTACVVYGKAGHGAETHGHHDAGQVCVDGGGERLIVDLGNPLPSYPADFFGPHRYEYYNAAAMGHNILVLGGRELRRGQTDRARIVFAEFDDARGGAWTFDLTPLYEGASRVRRTVAHLLPGTVAVLDEADLDREEPVSLRWHTADRAEPDSAGSFTARSRGVALSARVIPLDPRAADIRRGEHGYRSPFDRSRLGDPLHQRRESYVEAVCRARRVRLLTLFSVGISGESPQPWSGAGEAWSTDTPAGRVVVHVTELELSIERGAAGWRVPLTEAG